MGSHPETLVRHSFVPHISSFRSAQVATFGLRCYLRPHQQVPTLVVLGRSPATAP